MYVWGVIEMERVERGTMNVYQENGYKNRDDYLLCLADDYDLYTNTVYTLAEILGPQEDFDGLVQACQNQAELEWGR